MAFSTEEKLLIERMTHKAPVLVLGAGFSLGARNKHGEDLPRASELSEELFDKVLSKNKMIDEEDMVQYRANRSSLRSICDALRMEDMLDKRNKYLVERFSGCGCPSQDYHNWIKLYPWRYIFTLNIDDLVENIYKDQPIKKQPLVHRKHASTLDRNASLELFKLHGCVTMHNLGFVFDSEEYHNYTALTSWGLSAFGNLFMTNDVIFLGTEFQEEDLQMMIRSNLNLVSYNTAPHYFFISPSINNHILKRTIRKESNLHHIQWDTKQFLSTIKSQITDISDIRRQMRDYGMIFFDEKFKESEPEFQRYVSELYLGSSPRPIDYFLDYDIRRYEIENKAEKLSCDSGHHLVVVFGEAYVGKTCAATRLGVDLMSKGYEFSIFPLSYTMSASTYRERILEYLKYLPDGSKVAIMAENMSYYYAHIKMILDKCPPNISSLIFICTASIQDHNSKKYLLDCYNNLLEIHLTEKTADSRTANNIYDKLLDKNHLNKLHSYGSNRKDCVKYIRKINDLIEVLYLSQEGRYFVTYFSDLLANKANDGNKDAFMMLSCFSALDISEISINLFTRIVKHSGIPFDMNVFRKEYADIIRIQGDRITVRCSRLLWHFCESKLGEEKLLYWVKSAVRSLAQNLVEREETLQNEMFQKLLKVKSLRTKLHFSNATILELLISMNEYCKHLSYYWVQRGIIHRDMEAFEEANNALSEAARIRQNTSYHIRHAQAKNYLTWGVWAVKHEFNYAPYYFELGQKLIEDLIKEASTRFYAYSVHTYIDMTMKYYRARQTNMPAAQIQIIHNMLLQLTEYVTDKPIYSVINEFLNYCSSISYHGQEMDDLKDILKDDFDRGMYVPMNELFDVDELVDDGEL